MLINSETLDLYVFISRNVMPVAKTDLACPTSGAFDSKVGQSHRVDVSPHGSSFLLLLGMCFVHQLPPQNSLFVCLFVCSSICYPADLFLINISPIDTEKHAWDTLIQTGRERFLLIFFRREYVYCKKKNYIYINITYTV